MIRMVQTYVNITLSYGAQQASMKVVGAIGSLLFTMGSMLFTFVVLILKDIGTKLLTIVTQILKGIVFELAKNPVTCLTMGYVLFNVVANVCYSMRESIDRNELLWMVLDYYQLFGICFVIYVSCRLYHKMMGTAMFRGWEFVSVYLVEKGISCLALFAVACYLIATAIDHTWLKSIVVNYNQMVCIVSFLCIGYNGYNAYNAYHKKPKTE